MLRGSFCIKHAPQSLVRRGAKMNEEEFNRSDAGTPGIIEKAII